MNRLTLRSTVLFLSLSFVACSGAEKETESTEPLAVKELSARGASSQRAELEFVESYACTGTDQEGLVGGGRSDEAGNCMGYRVCDGGYDAMIECEDYRCVCTIDIKPVAVFDLNSECPGEEGPDWLLALCPFDVPNL